MRRRGLLAIGLLAAVLWAASTRPVLGQSAPAAPSATPPVAVAGSAGRETLTFDFANAALSPAAYRIEFDATGAGHYHSEPGQAAPPDAHGGQPAAFDQQIEVSSPLREQLLAVAHARRFLSGECESRQHKVAFTGQKTLTYTPAGAGSGAGQMMRRSCTFNWSPDAQLMKVADDFLAISMTIEEGRKLRLSYLHDRLSLDAELETLANEAKSGTALELENIRPELEAIVADGAVMRRAQARAAALLASLSTSPEAAAQSSR